MTDVGSTSRRLRLWGVLIAVGAIYAGAAFQAFADISHHRTWSWRDMVVGSVLWAASLGVLRWLQRVGPSFFWGEDPDYWRGDPQQRRVAAVVRAGVLPPDADADEWSVRLTWMSEQLRRDRWAIAAMCVVVGMLVAAAAIEANANAPGVWALAAALTAFAVVPFLWLTGRLRDTDRLLADLALEDS